MMFFKAKKSSSIIVFAWIAVLAGIVCFFLPFKNIFWQFFSPFLIGLFAGFIAFIHAGTVTIEVRSRELFFSRGVILIQQKRLPVRFITGVYCLQTPLQRILNQCMLVVCTSGSFSVFIGLSKDDVGILYQQLLSGGMET